MTKPSTEKKRKPKTKIVLMVKVPMKYEGLDCYAAVDADAASTLNGRNTFEASIPVRGRSLNHNSLWAVWYPQIGKATGQTAEAVKRECKLLYGVPILVAEDESFRRVWNAKFADDTYEQQLYMMKYLPVTSLLSRGQGTIYTECLIREYAQQGIVLQVI